MGGRNRITIGGHFVLAAHLVVGVGFLLDVEWSSISESLGHGVLGHFERICGACALRLELLDVGG